MGVEIERVASGKVSNEDVCMICGGVLVDGKDTTCQHMFCGPCIATALAEEQRCPSCKEPVTSAELQPIHRAIQSRLASFKVKCENQSRGCDQVVPLGLLPEHERNCEFAEPVMGLTIMEEEIEEEEKEEQDEQGQEQEQQHYHDHDQHDHDYDHDHDSNHNHDSNYNQFFTTTTQHSDSLTERVEELEKLVVHFNKMVSTVQRQQKICEQQQGQIKTQQRLIEQQHVYVQQLEGVAFLTRQRVSKLQWPTFTVRKVSKNVAASTCVPNRQRLTSLVSEVFTFDGRFVEAAHQYSFKIMVSFHHPRNVGHMCVFFVPLPGRQPEQSSSNSNSSNSSSNSAPPSSPPPSPSPSPSSELSWPIPIDRLRVIVLSQSPERNDKAAGFTSAARHFFAKHSPPQENNDEGRGIQILPLSELKYFTQRDNLDIQVRFY